MPVFTVTCKECQAQLKSPKPIPPGTVLTCPKCGVMFAAPKPAAVAAAKVNEDVEVVEDDVEVVDESPRPKKPAKPARAQDDDEERRPKRMKPRAKGKSNTGLILGLVGGAVFLALLGVGAILAWKFLSGPGADVVTAVDGSAAILAGADIDALGSSSAGPYFELAFNSYFNKYKRLANQEARDVLNKGALSISGNMQEGQILFAIQGKSSFSKDKLAEAFKAKPVTVGNKNVLEAAEGEQTLELYLPSSKTLVLTKDTAATAKAAVGNAGKAMSPDLAAVHKKASAYPLWGIINLNSPLFESMKNAPGMAAVPGMAEMNKFKAMYVGVKFGASETEIAFGMLATDAATAAAFGPGQKEQFKQGMNAGLTANPMAMVALAQLPELKALLQEFGDSATTSVDGNIGIVTGKVKTATLDPLIEKAAKPLMPPPPGARPGA